jgi:hypothetical protein
MHAIPHHPPPLHPPHTMPRMMQTVRKIMCFKCPFKELGATNRLFRVTDGEFTGELCCSRHSAKHSSNFKSHLTCLEVVGTCRMTRAGCSMECRGAR